MGSRSIFLPSRSSSLLLFVVIVALAAAAAEGFPRRQQVPCLFIFGDSLYDTGNNNNLNSLAKVNFPPYGIDFPGGPTGRFSNGRNIADIIGEMLGFKSIPAFASKPDDRQILVGVNYASGSAGILYESGKLGSDNIDMNQQLKNHEVTVSRIAKILGSKKAADEHLGQCLYLCNMGNNDYINNYILPQNAAIKNKYNAEQFAMFLITKYSAQINRMYELGARKLALAGISNIGCTPALIASVGTNGATCAESVNQLVALFNSRLRTLITQLKLRYPAAKFVYLDSLLASTLANKVFRVKATPCCQVNPLSGLCLPNTAPCSVRQLYFFWDGFHPSEVVNRITAPIFYSGIQRIL